MHLNIQSAGSKPPTLNIGRRGPNRQPTSTNAADYESAAEGLIAEMDRYGIEKALVMPPPQVPEQRNICSSQDILGVVKKYPDRLVFVGGGDTLNQLIHKYQPSEVTPEIRAIFEKIAEDLIRSGAKGFGETAVLHFSFTSHYVFEEVSPDHPLFLLSLKRISPNNPSGIKANIPVFERLLAHNRNAKIVWQHIGWDNTGYMTIELLRRLLQTHPNLYLSLRAEKRQYDMTGKPIPNRIVDEEWKVKPEWLKFISDFPDRFMIGTDNFFGAAITGPGQKPLSQTLEETWQIIDQLPPELAIKVGRDTATQVYNLK